VVARKPHAG